MSVALYGAAFMSSLMSGRLVLLSYVLPFTVSDGNVINIVSATWVCIQTTMRFLHLDVNLIRPSRCPSVRPSIHKKFF